MTPYYTHDANAPFARAAAVVASDATVIPHTDALWVGGTGDLALTMQDGSTVTLKSVPVGRLDVSVTQVKATGTTATNVVALYRN